MTARVGLGLAMLLSVGSAAAQTTHADTILTTGPLHETAPELVGGLDSLQARLVYPEAAREARIEGRVFVQFIVQPDGTVSDLKILRSTDPRFNAEALRVVASSRFRPGEQRGVPVALRYTLPVTFRLAEELEEAPPPDRAGDGSGG